MSKQPPVATSVPPLARTRPPPHRAWPPAVRPTRGEESSFRRRKPSAPPAATHAEASATACWTASDSTAPRASATAAEALNRSPAPHGSPPETAGAGTNIGSLAASAR
jgi:hypothetical protein